MHYRFVGGQDLLSEMARAKSEGEENILIDEEDIAGQSIPDLLAAFDKLQFRRIKMRINGLLTSSAAQAGALISRGVRIFEATFFHIDPKAHDEHNQPGAYKSLLTAMAEIYSASVEQDIPVVFSFNLRFDDLKAIPQAISELANLYPISFRIEGAIPAALAKQAAQAGIERGIWVEFAEPTELTNHAA